METIFGFIIQLILWLIVLFFIFIIFTDVDLICNLLEKILKCYEYIRQHFCKKSIEVNDDSETNDNGTDFYDSSSVWED